MNETNQSLPVVTPETAVVPTAYENAQSSLYLGFGNLVYALAKADGRVQNEEADAVRQLLAQQPFGDLAQYAFTLLEERNVSIEEAYAFGMRRLTDNRKALNDTLKKQFIDILLHVAGAHDDTSRKEQEMIKRFRRDLRRL
ncbi:TerB family tellurite resistance protein [Spirosoma montaniterrae]|uniref:TerB family tellurite resistance protein n=1 Tax=Spirosoma montaniterrae TaxID=1178516 RepID=UPI0009F858C6|nr:TerB family tellurite resistance protein [Spirosoma montaniterrae]